MMNFLDFVLLLWVTIGTIFFGVCSWRYFFHPLARFPGHPLFVISDFSMAICVGLGRSFSSVRKMHQRYGKIVRTGPNKVSILDMSVLHALYKSAQSFEKDDAYSLGASEGEGLFFIKDRSRHAKRRAIWAQAFTATSIEKYTPYLETCTSKLMTTIMAKSKIGPVDLGRLFNHWAFDLMGLMTFGPSNSFGLLENDDPDHLVENCREAASVFQSYSLSEIPSTFRLLSYLPVPNPIHGLQKLAEQNLKKFEGSEIVNSTTPIICSLLSQSGISHADVVDDVLFAIQAGFEATATILTFAMFYLTSNQAVVSQLQDELDHTFELPLLNAVIKESLRLGSPFPGLTRVTPPQGVMLAGQYIPGGTVVSVPVHALHLSSEHFSPNPERFEPHRWIFPKEGEPQFMTDELALIPFSFGPFGCLGRQLAMKELLFLIATLVYNFDITFPIGFDEEKFLKNVRNLKATHFDVGLLVHLEVRAL